MLLLLIGPLSKGQRFVLVEDFSFFFRSTLIQLYSEKAFHEATLIYGLAITCKVFFTVWAIIIRTTNRKISTRLLLEELGISSFEFACVTLAVENHQSFFFPIHFNSFYIISFPPSRWRLHRFQGWRGKSKSRRVFLLRLSTSFIQLWGGLQLGKHPFQYTVHIRKKWTSVYSKQWYFVYYVFNAKRHRWNWIVRWHQVYHFWSEFFSKIWDLEIGEDQWKSNR